MGSLYMSSLYAKFRKCETRGCRMHRTCFSSTLYDKSIWKKIASYLLGSSDHSSPVLIVMTTTSSSSLVTRLRLPPPGWLAKKMTSSSRLSLGILWRPSCLSLGIPWLPFPPRFKDWMMSSFLATPPANSAPLSPKLRLWTGSCDGPSRQSGPTASLRRGCTATAWVTTSTGGRRWTPPSSSPGGPGRWWGIGRLSPSPPSSTGRR